MTIFYVSLSDFGWNSFFCNNENNFKRHFLIEFVSISKDKKGRLDIWISLIMPWSTHQASTAQCHLCGSRSWDGQLLCWPGCASWLKSWKRQCLKNILNSVESWKRAMFKEHLTFQPLCACLDHEVQWWQKGLLQTIAHQKKYPWFMLFVIWSKAVFLNTYLFVPAVDTMGCSNNPSIANLRDNCQEKVTSSGEIDSISVLFQRAYELTIVPPHSLSSAVFASSRNIAAIQGNSSFWTKTQVQ